MISSWTTRNNAKRLVRSYATIDRLRIGEYYDTTYGTLWKEGPYFPRGTRVQVVGVHIDQGFCVRFPGELSGEPLEAWEDWDEVEFLAGEGSVDRPAEVSQAVLAEARAVLNEAEDGCHLHLQEEE
ncbi:MAG TPA: hypothetical protein VMD07_06770 [Candidatus Acidoferrales bacterium]|nr:hypothetical protein [Candidatus Acidoferrales bacterium]